MDVIVIESKAFDELLQKLESRIGSIVQQEVEKEMGAVVTEVAELVDGIVKKIDLNRKVNAIEELQLNYLTPEEACKILKCSKRSLHYYKENGTLKFYKHNGRLMFKLSDLQDFIEQKGGSSPNLV